jgi:DUF1126 PH-like domain
MTPLGQDKSAACYQPHDLRLGSSVDVHGRRFFLHDCDAFTRQYYQVRPHSFITACLLSALLLTAFNTPADIEHHLGDLHCSSCAGKASIGCASTRHPIRFLKQSSENCETVCLT